MANTARKTILTAKISGVLYDLMPKTTAERVVLENGKTAETAFSELLADVALCAKSADVEQQISDAINALIGDAPATYDTLKEIADYIAAHEDVATALQSAIGSKADKSELDALAATVEAIQTHTHENKAVLDGITAEKVAAWDGAVGSSKVYYSATQPESLKDGDIWVQLVD